MTKASLYERVMGRGFSRLAAPIQRFHRLEGRHELHGWVTTEAPASRLAMLLAKLLGTPNRAGSGPIRFELDARTNREIWTRHFPHRTMTSTLSGEGQRIVEQLGASRLSFHLTESGGSLTMRLQTMHFLGIPCPVWLMPLVVAEEKGAEDKLHFKVRASLPLVGRVTGYSGHLEVPAEEPR
jgi:hypothetical protein